MAPYIVLVGAVIQLFGGAAYALDTVRGRVKPNRVTFFLWTAAPLIAGVAALADGVGWAILPTFMAGVVPLLVLFASFVNKESYWKLGSFDYICGAFSVLALSLWLITDNPVVAIVFAILADVLAATPTFVKAWRHPETENGWPYATTIIAALLGFLAVKSWDFSEYAFSVYLILMCSAIVFATYHKQLCF